MEYGVDVVLPMLLVHQVDYILSETLAEWMIADFPEEKRRC